MRRLSSVRRKAAPLVVAGPLLVALVLAGHGTTWGSGQAGDTVRTVPVDGPFGAGSSEPDTDDLNGAHPVTRLTTGFQVQPAVTRDEGAATDVSDIALPARVLAAYRAAATSIGRSDPGCHLSWQLLAGIGKVESGHAFAGAVDRAGLTLSPILGPVLDGGPGVAAIRDTDDGNWDGDATWDRAVGPMQFIPSSWQIHGADGNGDGRRDPNNVADAALASGGYLCSGDRDLDVERDRRSAVFSYNHSWDYVDLVLAWADAYAGGTPVLTGYLPLPSAADGQRSRAGDPDRGRAPAPAFPASPSATPPPTATRSPAPPGPEPTPAPVPDPPENPTEAATTESSPSPSPSPSRSPSPSPDPTCPTASGSPSPTDLPSPSDSPTPTPSPTVVDPSATPTESPSPTPSESCDPGHTG